MRRFIKITLIEWRLYRRNFMTIFFALIFPVMMLLLFGTMYGNKSQVMFNGHGSVDYSLPGYICMIVAVTGLMSLPLTVAQYRERKILKRLRVTPIQPSDLLFSQILVNTITTIIGLSLLIILGKIIYNLHFFGNIGEAIVAFILILLTIFSLGLLIAGVSKDIKMATAISYIVYFPMLFLSGATMPLEIMPDSIKNISKLFPLTYGVDLFKGIWLGGSLFDYGTDLIILVSLMIVFSFVSLKFFKWE